MLKCTKNDSVWGSVPALGTGAPGLAGVYPCSLQSIFDAEISITLKCIKMYQNRWYIAGA